MSIAEAAKILGVYETWIYRLVKAKRIRVVERGTGRGNRTLLDPEDVERERLRRTDLLKSRLQHLDSGEGELPG